jgi:hypothetical protein
MNQPDAVVTLCKLLQNVSRPICRAVVDDYKLEVPIRLVENALDRFFEVRLPVENGHNDTN